MKLNTLRRTGGLAAAALTLSLGLAACGGEEEPTSGSDETTQSEEPTQEDTEPMEEDASAQTYGAGCAQVPTDGAGSFNGMATAPVASAASANPLLKTLVAAVDRGRARRAAQLGSRADRLRAGRPGLRRRSRRRT